MKKDKRTRGWMCLLLVGVMGGLLPSEVRGQEEGGATTPGANESSAEVEAVEAIALARDLIDYGVKAESPEALVAAARILTGTPVALDQLEVEERGSEEGEAKSGGERLALDVGEILDAAFGMTNENDPLRPAIEALRNAPLAKGATGGPKYGVFRVGAFGTTIHTIRFDGSSRGIPGLVEVKGDGDTDLDCYLLDSTGRRVVSDTDYSDWCVLSFTMWRTAPVTIRIDNHGIVYNEYEIATN
jgi:hypothetical protein